MDLGDVVWTLTPTNVNGKHWGLLCLNMAQQQAFYDDGLKQSPLTSINELADNLLKAVSETQWNITLQFSGLECLNSHYLGKVVLVVALV